MTDTIRQLLQEYLEQLQRLLAKATTDGQARTLEAKIEKVQRAIMS